MELIGNHWTRAATAYHPRQRHHNERPAHDKGERRIPNPEYIEKPPYTSGVCHAGYGKTGSKKSAGDKRQE